MLEDPILQAWQNAPMSGPLAGKERDLADEGLAALEAGEIVRGDVVSTEIAG